MGERSESAVLTSGLQLPLAPDQADPNGRPPRASVEERNKAVVRRVEALWQADALDALDEHFAPDVVSHAEVPLLPPGLAGWKLAHRQITIG